MWILLAFGSAFFAGMTAILAKIGIRDTDSNVVTAIRTVVVLLFSWLLVFLTGAQGGLWELEKGTLLFLILSGLATGASWLCYFKALYLGDVNRVTPIDKSSSDDAACGIVFRGAYYLAKRHLHAVDCCGNVFSDC